MNTSNSSMMWKGADTSMPSAMRKHRVVDERSPPDSVFRFCAAHHASVRQGCRASELKAWTNARYLKTSIYADVRKHDPPHTNESPGSE